MNKEKQTSSKVLLWLIVLMFALQTIDSICGWYIAWLGFVHYGDNLDQAVSALQVDEEISFSLHVLASMVDLLATLRLAIADSIMVSTSTRLVCHFFSADANSYAFFLKLEGLEVLGYI
jgi:hypothetical protein